MNTKSIVNLGEYNMDNAINTLSGIEFENLCQSLLQQLGFEVETTKQSGDGGIDLIAYNHQAFTSGKYIVQCKRYSGGVGEPIVRDLYGVVAAERANKGILMTTGYFSMSAIKFASDKNIELIDGERLSELLYKNNLIISGNTNKIKVFTQYKCFDSSKYEFFKSMINQNMCTIEMGRDFLFSFMFDYFRDIHGDSDDRLAMIHTGFSEEYLRLFDWYTGKYFKRGKEQLALLPYYIHKYKGIAQLYNFDIFDYVRNRYDFLTGWSGLKIAYYSMALTGDVTQYTRYRLSSIRDSDYKDIIDNLMNPDVVKYIPSYRFYELMNLLSLFSYFNIESGVDKINKILCDDNPEFQEWVKTLYDYQLSKEHFEICTSQIRPVRFGKVYGNSKEDYIEVKHDERISVEKYFELYKNMYADKINTEIDKINELLNSISQ